MPDVEDLSGEIEHNLRTISVKLLKNTHLLDGDVTPHGELDCALEAVDDEERVVVLVVHRELQ